MIEPYPLQWPTGFERTRYPERARFGARFAPARDGVLHELRRLGATNVVISTNVPTRRDGLPYADMRQPDDPGVAVYFHYRRTPTVIPIDRWDRVEDNLRACQKAIDAIRGLDRWGAKMMVDAAFKGFAALPESTTAWWNVLGVHRDATRAQIDAAYRRQLKIHHPDVGGSREAFDAVQQAYRDATALVTA